MLMQLTPTTSSILYVLAYLQLGQSMACSMQYYLYSDICVSPAHVKQLWPVALPLPLAIICFEPKFIRD